MERIREYIFYFRIFPESKSIELAVFDHRSKIGGGSIFPILKLCKGCFF